jgi:predicted ATPase/DNA-binding SARP family transcriptional activator
MDDIPVGKNGQKALQVQLMGGFSVSVNGLTIPETQGKSRRARSLVKLLALAPAHRLHRDQLIEILWPDSDLAAAANNFHQTLHGARRVLEPAGAGVLLLEDGFLCLSAGEKQALSVDVEAFETGAARAKDCQDPAVYQAALALYQGDLLPDDLYEEWTIQRRAALRQTHLNLLLDLARLLETRQEYPGAIETLLSLLLDDKDNEKAHALLMRLYALSGQRQQALRQYQALKEMLQAELDTEPNESTTQLYEAIQSGQFSSQKGTDFPQAASVTPSALPTGTITFLFTDIEGNTTLWERQPKAMPKAVARHHAILREIIEANGGVVFKVIGDQFQAAFRVAQLSLAAAIAAQRALQIEPWPEAVGPVRVRMGLHTGPAELVGDDYAVSHTLNRAARVMGAGFGGQILLSQVTADLVTRELSAEVDLRDLGEHNLKGLQIPEHLFQVCAPGLPCNFPRLPTAITPKHNLPNLLTSFIGREKQIREISQLVKDHRLVTLTGSGGTGKTRLALKVAEELLDHFPDGVFLVELAPLSDPELVPQACTQTLEVIEQSGFSFTELLAHYLEKKDLLLILDNCEHVIEACTQLVDRLLKACPRLHILATSREILSVPGENPFRVTSLEIPDPHSLPPLLELVETEAVRLFMERAGQVSPKIALNEGNALAIAQICQRLDGIPLAIELAAGRARMMTIEQVAARLNNAFHLLTGGSRAVLPRQQTLKATIDWSYNLLSQKERLLLQRMSVFAGGWTLEAAEAVCADPADKQFCLEERLDSFEMLDLLAQLVDKSLVLAEAGESETRYHLLETIRQYARDRLLEAGCSQQVRDRHLAYFTRLSGQAEPHLRGKGQIEWFNRLDHELDNLRVALEWSLTENVEQGLKLMADLMWFWWIRGLFNEGPEWLKKLLAAESAEHGAGPLENGRALQRARGLRAFFYLSRNIYSLSFTDSQALIEESTAILRRLGAAGRRELGISLLHMLYLQPNFNLPAAETQEMLEIFRQENERFYLSEYLFAKGGKAVLLGEMDEVEVYGSESLVISREIEDYDGISSRTELLGFYRIHTGDYAIAEALFTEAIEASRMVRNRWLEMAVHEDLVEVALARGQFEEAAQLSEMILQRYQEMDYHAGISSALRFGLISAWAMGEYPRAVRLGNEVIEGHPEALWIQKQVYFWLGRVAMAEGDFMQAELRFKQANSLLPQVSGVVGRGFFLLGWSALLCKQGKMIQAARVLGAIEDIYRQTGYSRTPLERSEHEETLAVTRAVLGEEAFSAAWQEGQAMTIDQAIEYVNGEKG